VKLFGTDGIRGEANIEPITATSALRLAVAAARVLARHETNSTAIVGRDTRASGEMLEAAFAAGLTSYGIDVLLTGVVPTPAIAYLTPTHQAVFGVVISASHNPFQDNGIKFFGPDGYKLSDELELAINRDCGSTHPEAISSFVRETGAAFGLAHDGDADRVLFCDETGVPLDGDEFLAIASVNLLARGQLRKKTVVATVMSNFGLDPVLNRSGGKVLRTNVGDRYVMDAMIQHELNFGGEQSGHIIFRDFTTTGDGLVAALQLMEIIQRSGKPLSELRKVLKKFPQVLRNATVREKLPFEQFGDLMKQIAEAESKLAGNGRVLLRYSGTEPKARLLLEGPDEGELEELAEGIMQELTRNLGL
jgi:phosphomannomutase